MKKTSCVLIILLLLMVGCGENKQSTDELITVDVTTTDYPKKELILQDFMDVEYIPLETNDDFLNQGIVWDIGEKFIVVTNLIRLMDGDIFVYDRRGKALRKINRKGQGGEEYSGIAMLGIALDEDNNEMYVNDAYARNILVYDLYGKFKRSLRDKESIESLFYTNIFNYGSDHLIGGDEYEKRFVLISKQDGSIIHKIKIPFEEKKLLVHRSGNTMVGPGYLPIMIPFKGNWILSEISSDTVYTFLPDYSLRPFLVRTPPIQSMEPGVFLILRLLSDRYYFMETIKNVYDWNTDVGFPKTFMMYDKQEKAFFRYAVYNGDYTTKKEIYMNWLRPVNHEILWQRLESHRLVEDYNKGILKGKLKEIAATLNEDDNPVIMLVKHKK